MIAYVYYSQNGFPVTEFNYDDERNLFKSIYSTNKSRNFCSSVKLAEYSTELAIDMIRLLVVEKQIDHSDLRFVYKGKVFTIDEDGMFDVEGEDKSMVFEFCSMSKKIARKLIEGRSANRKRKLKRQIHWCITCKVNVVKYIESCIAKGIALDSNALITKERFMEIIETKKPVRHLPYKWCEIKNITIIDNDGWREDGKSWKAPIVEEEFDKRIVKCTQKMRTPPPHQPRKMDAEQRALEMMKIKINELPPIAYAYAKYLCNIYGGCGEVLMTAWAHYAQAIEGLSCENDLYLIGLEGTRWFEEAKEKYQSTTSTLKMSRFVTD